MKIVDSFKSIFQKKSDQNKDMDNYTEREFVNYYVSDLLESVWSGEKFAGSFGVTKNYSLVDYYTLRARSMQLFKENPYARGLIRRLITNIIYKGLNLESNPIANIIGMTDEQSIEWAENVEIMWDMWSRDAYICDYHRQKNLGQIQAEIKQTALISGDCLVILRISQITQLPTIEVIDGTHIQTPINYEPRKGNYIKYGVEFDSQKRQVAYHVYVQKTDGIGYEYKRIPAYGEKSGRRIAWLVYGSDKLLDEVRGEPILAIALYSLKDLDRYKDSASRAAVVNSLYPFFIKKTEKGPSNPPFGGVRIDKEVTVTENSSVTNQSLKFGYDLPGTVPSMPYGTDIGTLNFQKSDINLGKFEEIIINTIAWINEIPPESLRLLFQSNFSASRQANNELQLLIDKQAWQLGNDFMQNVYEEWVISNILIGNIKADGLLDAWMQNNWIKYNAWLNCEFTGLNRPSVDDFKDAQAEELKLKLGVTTFDQASRKLSKMKIRTVLRKRKTELDLFKKFGISSSVDEDSQGIPLSDSSFTKENNPDSGNNNNNGV